MRGDSHSQMQKRLAKAPGNGNGSSSGEKVASVVRSLSTRLRNKALSIAGPGDGASGSLQVSPVCEIVLLPSEKAPEQEQEQEREQVQEQEQAKVKEKEELVRLRSHSFRQSKSTMSFREAKNNRLQLNAAANVGSHALPRTEGSFSSQKAIAHGGLGLLSPPNALHSFRSASIADCTVRSPTIEFLPMYSELRKQKNLRNEIKDVWRHFDQDGDGSISMRELANVMTQFGHTPSELELRHMIEQVDEDGDGRIGWQEFSKMMDSQFDELDKQEQKMRRVFEYFDLNKDQFIDKHELFTVMNRLGDQLSLADADDMIRAADCDCDGLVSYSEFVAMMSSHLAQALAK